jgi:hypothetical protein
MTCPSWSEVKDRFDFDGSLRDVYVPGTTRNDWERFVGFIAQPSFSASMTRDEKQLEVGLPEDFFDYDGGASYPLMKFVVAGIDCVCHFFAEVEIEFDIDPVQMKSETQFSEFVSFLEDIAGLLHKDVVLTDENVQSSVIVRVPAK